MGGGGPSGPSDAQLRAQREHEAAMMAMQQQLALQQMNQQQEMLNVQMETAERQRRATEEASRQAAANTQSTVAAQAAQQNMQGISDQLTGRETLQFLRDQAAQREYEAAVSAGASNVTGGYDMDEARQSALGSLTAASGTLPKTGANLTGRGFEANPALTTAAANKKQANLFALPETKDLIFGGT
jgi:hypothetical protein